VWGERLAHAARRSAITAKNQYFPMFTRSAQFLATNPVIQADGRLCYSFPNERLGKALAQKVKFKCVAQVFDIALLFSSCYTFRSDGFLV
jgi:hypothetical protein